MRLIEIDNIFFFQAYADALLTIPKTLAVNSGFDTQDAIVKLLDEANVQASSKTPIGLDLNSGEPINPVDFGVYDNYIVKKQILNSW